MRPDGTTDATENKHVNDRPPNFYDANNKFYLVTCYSCGDEYGRENYAGAVSSGACAWCGWGEQIGICNNEQKPLDLTSFL